MKIFYLWIQLTEDWFLFLLPLEMLVKYIFHGVLFITRFYDKRIPKVYLSVILMAYAKVLLVEEQEWNYYTHSWWDKRHFPFFNKDHHHYHHVMPPARLSLTLSRHLSLSLIASGRSSGLHPVSSHSCCM